MSGQTPTPIRREWSHDCLYSALAKRKHGWRLEQTWAVRQYGQVWRVLQVTIEYDFYEFQTRGEISVLDQGKDKWNRLSVLVGSEIPRMQDSSDEAQAQETLDEIAASMLLDRALRILTSR